VGENARNSRAAPGNPRGHVESPRRPISRHCAGEPLAGLVVVHVAGSSFGWQRGVLLEGAGGWRRLRGCLPGAGSWCRVTAAGSRSVRLMWCVFTSTQPKACVLGARRSCTSAALRLAGHRGGSCGGGFAGAYRRAGVRAPWWRSGQPSGLGCRARDSSFSSGSVRGRQQPRSRPVDRGSPGQRRRAGCWAVRAHRMPRGQHSRLRPDRPAPPMPRTRSS
jgi:hypothetical protein